MIGYSIYIRNTLIIFLCLGFFIGLNAQTIDFQFDTKDYEWSSITA